MTSVMWFRRDLRLADNPALVEAVADEQVLPLYVLDPRLWGPAGESRRHYLGASLRSLDAALRQRQASLQVVRGNPVRRVVLAAKAVGAERVHVAADFGPYGRKRDEEVEAALAEAGVDVRTGTEATAVRAAGDGRLAVTARAGGADEELVAGAVYNCTYSRINALLVRSGLEPIRLKHELTEMPLIELPDELRGKAFTLMCGPFFSVMPFPARGLDTLSHVRYTPHAEWADAPGVAWRDPYAVLAATPRRSQFPHMIRDAARYLPALRGSRQVDSLWEVKTVLPKSEVDDSRPVLYRRDCGLPNLTSLLGAKIDNVYDVLEVLDGEAARAADGR